MEHLSLSDAMKCLNSREHEIISLRFFSGKTQMEVADLIGISQAQVSRLEKMRSVPCGVISPRRRLTAHIKKSVVHPRHGIRDPVIGKIKTSLCFFSSGVFTKLKGSGQTVTRSCLPSSPVWHSKR